MIPHPGEWLKNVPPLNSIVPFVPSSLRSLIPAHSPLPLYHHFVNDRDEWSGLTNQGLDRDIQRGGTLLSRAFSPLSNFGEVKSKTTTSGSLSLAPSSSFSLLPKLNFPKRLEPNEQR